MSAIRIYLPETATSPVRAVNGAGIELATLEPGQAVNVQVNDTLSFVETVPAPAEEPVAVVADAPELAAPATPAPTAKKRSA